MSIRSTAGGDYGMTSMEADPDEPEHDEPVELAQALGKWAAAHPLPEPPRPTQADLDRSDALARERALWDAAPDDVEEEDEPEAEEYDPGPAADDEGGMSEYRHYPDWQEVDRAEYEAGL